MAGAFWSMTLTSLLLYWAFSHKRGVYATSKPGQWIPYISDTGAFSMKPVFVVGCALTTVFCCAGVFVERLCKDFDYLDIGKVKKEFRRWFPVLVISVGGIALFSISFYDSNAHNEMHTYAIYAFMSAFGFHGIIMSLESAEHQRWMPMCKSWVAREPLRYLRSWYRVSFCYRLVSLSLVLGLAFAWLGTKDKDINKAAGIEWTLSYSFTFLIFAQMIDLYIVLEETTTGK